MARSGFAVKTVLLMGSIGALALNMSAAHAQSASDGATVEDIIVTAQKRSENAQSVPIAISAYSADTLDKNNIRGLADLVNVSPALNYTAQGPTSTLFLRGVGNNASFPGSEAEVQTYVDGVYYAANSAGFLKFNNIKSLEIDKGPQGTLFGRNATGGVIQITTRDPSADPSADISIGYGNYNAKEADFYGTIGVTKSLAADLALHYEDHDGWGKNITTGKDAFANREFDARTKWLLTLSDTTQLTFAADYGRHNTDIGAAFPLAAVSWLAPGSAVPNSPHGYFTTTQDTPSHNDIRYGGASLKVETQIGELPFVSITAYRNTKALSVLDADLSATPYENAFFAEKQTTVSQEFQLLSPKDLKRLKWVLGAYYFYSAADSDPFDLRGGFLTAGFGTVNIDNVSKMLTNSYALFGQATYDLTDTTHLTGGIRYTWDDLRQSAHIDWTYPTGPGPAPFFLGLTGVNAYPKTSFSAPTARVSLSQDISPHAMVYVSYNHGYKSGTYNNYVVLSNQGPPLQPETIDAYEGGVKSDLFGRRLRLNASAFYYDYSNLQVASYQPLAGIVLQNAASAEIKGAEVEGNLALGANAEIDAGVSVLDATYSSFPNAPLYTTLPLTAFNSANFGLGGVSIGTADASGKVLPFAPKFSAFISGRQRFEISDAGALELTAAVKYQSREYFTPDNRFSQAGYALLSASAAWVPTGGRWSVSLWGRNLTNERTWAQISPVSFGDPAIPNEPLSFGVRFDLHTK